MKACIAKRALGLFVAAGAFLSIPQSALAQDVLTFEGVPNFSPVGGFYAPEYIFSPATLALVDADNGGGGNFANEPSPNTVMFFLDANNAILNAVNGFDTGFSFFYTSSTNAVVNVYGGLNGTGSILGSINLTAQFNDNCVGDPGGGFCNWTNAGVAFTGTAYSIDFGGTANQTAYDNITFGSAVAGNGAVPEPSTWAMLLIGFGAVGGAMRSRRRQRLAVSYT